MGVDWFAMVFGLGFVLSFGYWCTNFLVVQRAMAAKNMGAARRTPLIAAVPKMIFPVLVILPGMIAVALAFDRQRMAIACRPDCRRASLSPDYSRGEGRSASHLEEDEAAGHISKTFDMKLDQAKVARWSTNAAHRSEDGGVKDGLQDAVGENDYDGVILSLVKKYCPPGCWAWR